MKLVELQIQWTDFIVLDNTSDLKLLNAVGKWNEFSSSPDKTVSGNLANTSLEFCHVSCVIPGFYIKNDHRFGNWSLLRFCHDRDIPRLRVFFLIKIKMVQIAIQEDEIEKRSVFITSDFKYLLKKRFGLCYSYKPQKIVLN